jgi:hypothetical protein
VIAPRVVPIVSVTGVVGLILCAVLTWVVMQTNDAEEQRDCQRSVAARDDSRAMWLYLIDSADKDRTRAEQKRFDDFVAELDKRLPPLKCDDGDFVPDEDKT